jgi:hypothetical protein
MQEHRYYSDAMASYIILKCPEKARKDYQYRMLAANKINGLLPCRYRAIDGEEFLYYNITSRKSIARLFDHKSMDGEQLRRLLFSAAEMVQTLSVYLLDPDKLLMNPEHIFFDYEQENYCFIYYPEEQSRQDCMKLFEYLAEHLESNDEGDRIVIYRLCELAENDSFLLKPELLNHEYEQAGRIQNREEKIEMPQENDSEYSRSALNERWESTRNNENETDELDDFLENREDSNGGKRAARKKSAQEKEKLLIKENESRGKKSPMILLILSILLAAAGIGLYIMGIFYQMAEEQLFAVRAGMLLSLVSAIGTALFGMFSAWKKNKRDLRREEKEQVEERRNAMVKTLET